jgi:4-hydroxybenzoate polyprenyltransferase
LALGASHMGWQIRVLDIENAEYCLKLFQSNGHFGWILFAGLVGSAIIKVL